jgi:hypothetical protein
MELEQEIVGLSSMIETTKKKFQDYITNPQFPLEERLQLFYEAPDFMVGRDQWIYKGLDFLVKNCKGSFRSEPWWRDVAEDYGKGCTIDIVDWLISTAHNMDYWRKNPGAPGRENAIRNNFYENPELLDRAKEQLMKDNIRYMTLDW